MRFVVRVPCPAALDGPTSSGGRETEMAIAFYCAPDSSEKAYPFAAYKDDTVKEALEQMFGWKCAYCETDYSASSPPDVEHYRPKGSVRRPDGSIRKPGYYWLAATWSNLLPSCIDCNRARKQLIDGRRSLSGKACQFPLVDERTRATRPGEESREEPLLLNPCVDDPSDHLDFIDGGIVRPGGLGGHESVRGKHTIDVLGLARYRLTRRRAKHLRWIDLALAHLKEALCDLDADPTNSVLEQRVRREMDEIKRLLEADSEYTLMAFQRVRAELPDLELA